MIKVTIPYFMILNHDKQKQCRSEQRKEDEDDKRERLSSRNTSCEVCGREGVEHHEDYAKPFDTRFLCGRHHRRYHAVVDPKDTYRESQLDEFILAEKKNPNEVLRPEANQFFQTLVDTVELEHADINASVSLYYDIQQLMLSDANRYRLDIDEEAPEVHLKKTKKSGGTSKKKIHESPLHEFFERWLTAGQDAIEGRLEKWVKSDDAPPETQWAIRQVGVGPLLAAGLAGHIDVTRANHRSSLWLLAGYAPGTASRKGLDGKFVTVPLDRLTPGVPAPFNQRLRTLCYKISDCIVKAGDKEVKGKYPQKYGKLYRQIKGEEVRRNEQGFYEKAAANELSRKKIQKTSVKNVLESGKLTKGHIESRTRRRLMKEFLADYWVEGRKGRGLSVGTPYPVGILGHDDREAA